MAILKLIKYTNSPGCFEANWVERKVEGEDVLETPLRCIAYSGDQIDLFRADVATHGGEIDESFLDDISAEWVPPVPTDPAPVVYRDLTSLEFLELFTDAEQVAVVSATMTSPIVKLWYDKMLAAMNITLSDPRTESGLDALVDANLLTAERKAEIVEAMR